VTFKVDENLPVELAEDLRGLGHGCDTVVGEGLCGAPGGAFLCAGAALDTLAKTPRRKAMWAGLRPHPTALMRKLRQQQTWIALQLSLWKGAMKKKTSPRKRNQDRDTMRPEYDFSAAVRGVTAARYAQGANVPVIDPEKRLTRAPSPRS
jgi:hypothetical protein